MKVITLGELLSQLRLSTGHRGALGTFDEVLAYLDGFMHAWDMDRHIGLERSDRVRFGKWLVARKLPDDAKSISSTVVWDLVFKNIVKNTAMSDHAKLGLLRQFYAEYQGDTDFDD